MMLLTSVDDTINELHSCAAFETIRLPGKNMQRW